ncbi:MAG TPA: hypothetical protein VJR89_16125, partial [Polyangiales bacterium]|nr:hypothetical protein [Polyangiales bacterium]
WNRRYDAHGRSDPHGTARELHVERALEVTDWINTGDPSWLAAQRCRVPGLDVSARARCEVLCGDGPESVVGSQYLRAARVFGSGELALPDWRTLRGLTVIDGALTLSGAFGELRVTRGRTVALPAGLRAITCRLERGHALLSSVVA